MKKTGLYKKMTLLAIVPVLLLGIAITILSYVRFTGTIYERARGEMKNTASFVMMAYDKAYDGDYVLSKNLQGTSDLYKGNNNITQDNTIVDELALETDSQISLIYKDIRINTTFRDGTGPRYTGVYTNAETTEAVLGREESVFYSDVAMFNDKYLVYYEPLRNSTGEVVGMVEVAQSSASIKKAVLKAVWPITALTLLGMLLAIYVSYKNTTEITSVLQKLQVFMNKVAGGNLNTELETDVLKRQDELGDISKSATSMQRSIRAFVETDPLTQLGNRRYVKNQLDKIKTKYLETGQQYSVAIGDIDFFKKVNDTYGHNAGDEVLKAVASTLKTMMNGKGFAARWGGEEFIMVFDKSGMYESADWLWKILGKIREMVVSADGYDIKVTMTFGVVDGNEGTSEAMVEAADEKLYFGKQNGRNRVVVDLPVNNNIPMEEMEMVEFKGYKKGVNFGGWLSQCNHTFERYENFIKEEDVRKVSELGFDHVRVPVDYNVVEKDDGSEREGGMEYIQRAIDWCGKYNINMILDLHKAAGFFFHEEANESGLFDDEALQERFYSLWEKFAKNFGKYSDRVAFELLNEVTDKEYMPKWAQIINTCIKRIRAIAPDVYIVVGGYWNNSPEAVADLPMPLDSKIVYTFHCYEPITFTHQHATWVNTLKDFEMKYPATVGEFKKAQEEHGFTTEAFKGLDDSEMIGPKYFENYLEIAIRAAAERNVPLYCGEYGVIDLAPAGPSLNWLKDYTSVMNKYNIGRALWSYRSMNFGLMDAHYDEVREEMVKIM
ncbi:MAG: cellulase family glycosylhydrolase [Lachnospiraceae bacterium]|nr:cellulase family glycosylhydrolase [Lachnospiraceae bacterium]